MAAKNPQPKWLVAHSTDYYSPDCMQIVSAPSAEKAIAKVAKNYGYNTKRKTYTAYALGEVTKAEVTPTLDIKVK